MQDEIIQILFYAFMSACFSTLLNYALGNPGADPENINPGSIFFNFSVLLAYNRLTGPEIISVYDEADLLYAPEDTCNNRGFKKQKKDFINKTIFISGRDYFVIEKVIGMCVYCSNFWVSLIIALVVNTDPVMPFWIYLFSIPSLSHFFLKQINK